MPKHASNAYLVYIHISLGIYSQFEGVHLIFELYEIQVSVVKVRETY